MRTLLLIGNDNNVDEVDDKEISCFRFVNIFLFLLFTTTTKEQLENQLTLGSIQTQMPHTYANKMMDARVTVLLNVISQEKRKNY